MILPFLFSFSGGSHVTDNDDELSAVTITFSGGPSGANAEYGKLFIIRCCLLFCMMGDNEDEEVIHKFEIP